MQPEDYMTDKDLIELHLEKLKYGFPSDMEYHAQELRRFLPKELIEKIKNSKLEEITRFG
ncbi:MAG TPA: hypothetical protein HA282_00285 [Nanoarchaeota archaeon]|nr:hypothetical protein [Candidatus Pacearchaeota archaeon]HIH18145.1 hypothetical protein [Nanoarchaeota archaeon]HIH34122.1 hypothetical protein [Nanoarchaeota archaeon]HIH51300.1 hypothetical protein [Nanoarchaeota archaeon]HIH65639.1 hypothetical protein [Nanoarchaeota archaeon]